MRNETLNVGTVASHREAPAVARRYWLAKHAYLCVARGQVVLLDLKRDKYLSVASPEELAPWVTGWPVVARAAGADGASPTDPLIPASLSKLTKTGVFTDDPASGKTAEVTAITRPSAALVHFQLNVRPRVKLPHIIAVGRAWLIARTARRRLSLQCLVERVQERKARATHLLWDVHQARDLVTAFLWLRPLFYSSRDACLLDSLVLLELLAQHGLFPTWVYGVKLAPFAAHCWVQQEGLVLNDAPEHAGSYIPILCV